MDMLLRTAEIAGAVAGLVAAAGLLVSFFQWAHKITDGSKCQLRSDMLSIYYHNRECETIRQYEYENFVLCYEAYRALGGNSFIEKIYTEVKKWEVVS